jgi:hypothetical protein
MGFSPSIGLAVLEILDHGLKRLATDVNGTSEEMIDRHDQNAEVRGRQLIDRVKVDDRIVRIDRQRDNGDVDVAMRSDDR